MMSKRQYLLRTAFIALAVSSPTFSYAAVSSEVKPVNVTPYKVEKVTASQDIPEGKYNDLPICDPNKINCKDMNDHLARSDIPEFCPDVCRVTRNVVNKLIGAEISKTNVNNFIPAQCPSGYTTSTSYGYEREIKYTKNPPSFPVTDRATYDSYMQNPGAKCVAVPGVSSAWQCTPPPGFIYTDKFAPSAKVCVRVYTKWQKSSTPTN
jgi:hypothetical protein